MGGTVLLAAASTPHAGVWGGGLRWALKMGATLGTVGRATSLALICALRSDAGLAAALCGPAAAVAARHAVVAGICPSMRREHVVNLGDSAFSGALVNRLRLIITIALRRVGILFRNNAGDLGMGRFDV